MAPCLSEAPWCPSPIEGLLLDGVIIAGLCWGIAKITRKALEEIGLVKPKS